MERRSREKQKEVAATATLSSEEDDHPRVVKDQDDVRQYRCYKKYEEIVKQVLLIDEMTDSMEHRARYQRRRRSNRGSSGTASTTTTTTSMPEQGNIDGMLVQTITRFLNELNPNDIGSDPKPSDQ